LLLRPSEEAPLLAILDGQKEVALPEVIGAKELQPSLFKEFAEAEGGEFL
jgi:hypothetical protein